MLFLGGLIDRTLLIFKLTFIIVLFYIIDLVSEVLYEPPPCSIQYEIVKNSKIHIIELNSPIYLYDGQFATSVAYVNDEEQVKEIKTLTCVKDSTAMAMFRTHCKYASCAYELNSTIERLIMPKGSHAFDWLLEDLQAQKSFKMVNFKQSWFAGVSLSEKPELTTWYRIGRNLEHYIAENVLVKQKKLCTPLFPRRTTNQMLQFKYFIDTIPLCGIENLKQDTSSGPFWMTKLDFYNSWVSVCRWRAKSTDQWRILSSNPKNNILNVFRDDSSKKMFIKWSEENKTFTEYLPNENLINKKNVTPTIYV